MMAEPDGFPLYDDPWRWLDRVPTWLIIAVAVAIGVGTMVFGIVA